MWRLFPRLGLLKAVFWLFCILLFAMCFISANSYRRPGVDFTIEEFKIALSLVTPASLVLIAVIYILGKWGWRIFWNAPLLGAVLGRTVCPDLNGKWRGQVNSNSPHSQKSNPVSATITADMFGLTLTLESDSEYQESDVLYSALTRDPLSKNLYLFYIFEGHISQPTPTDIQTFHGAARLKVDISGDAPRLEGTYWTDRAWHQRQNTAGYIVLERIAEQ